MGVKKRKYKTKDGKDRIAPNWSYEFFIDGQRYQGTIDGTVEIPEGKTADKLTKADAEEVCRQLKKKEMGRLSGGNVVGVTFEEAAMSFYQDYLGRLNKRRNSAQHKNIKDSYNGIITRLTENFGGMLLSQIDKTQIAAFKAKRKRTGISDKTIRNDILCLSSIYTFSVDEGLCEEDDVPNFRATTRKLLRSKQRTRHLSPDEYDELIKQYDDIAENNAAQSTTHGRYKQKKPLENGYNTKTRKRMVMFLVQTGLRKEELLSLRESDCHFAENGIDVKETKNGSDRWVPLSALAKELLQQQLREKEVNGIDSHYIFSKKNGMRFSDFRKGFQADCLRAKVGDICIHDLRRTFGTWQLQGIRCKQKRIEEVSAMLGHGDISITQRAYAFLDKKSITL